MDILNTICWNVPHFWSAITRLYWLYSFWPGVRCNSWSLRKDLFEGKNRSYRPLITANIAFIIAVTAWPSYRLMHMSACGKRMVNISQRCEECKGKDSCLYFYLKSTSEMLNKKGTVNDDISARNSFSNRTNLKIWYWVFGIKLGQMSFLSKKKGCKNLILTALKLKSGTRNGTWTHTP